MIEVQLGGGRARGRVALVDDEDFALVSAYSWSAVEHHRPNCRPEGPYALASPMRDGKRTYLRMHKLITGYPMTDHINGNGLDNRRQNLRPATFTQNNENRRPTLGSSSRYLGVSWNSRKRKWQAAIEHLGNSRYLGLFGIEEEAAAVRDLAAIELHGEFARLNLPELLVAGRDPAGGTP